MAGERLPQGMRLIPRTTGFYQVTCNCDWRSNLMAGKDSAIDAAIDHARRDAWCSVHRNLTPVGADPVMQDES